MVPRRKRKKVVAAFLIGLLISAGCITSNRVIEEQMPEKKIAGGYLKEVIDYSDIGKENISRELGFPDVGVQYGFSQENGKRYLIFDNMKVDAERGVHYFYIPYGKGVYYFYISYWGIGPFSPWKEKSYVDNYSREEFEGWNLRVNITELGDRYGIEEIYFVLVQDNKEIKDTISRYRNKTLREFNMVSSYDHHGSDKRYFSAIQSANANVTINTSITAPEYKSTYETYSIDKDRFLENALDVLLTLNYTNEGYEHNYQVLSSDFDIGVDVIVSENLIMTFADNSTIEIAYRNYGGFIVGIVELNGHGFIFSFFTGDRDSTKNRLFYNAVMQNVN